MAESKFDLLLKGGQVIDPANKVNGLCDVGIVDDKIAKVEADIDTKEADHVVDVSGSDSNTRIDRYSHPRLLHPSTRRGPLQCKPESRRTFPTFWRNNMRGYRLCRMRGNSAFSPNRHGTCKNAGPGLCKYFCTRYGRARAGYPALLT